MHYTQHTDHCLSDANRAEVAALCDKLAGYEQALKNGFDAKARPILDLCHRDDDLPVIQALADTIRARFDHVIICGSGGSGLSGEVLHNIDLQAKRPTIHVLDNIDPVEIDALFADCPPEKTTVIAISKSGNTVETISQFFAFYHHFKPTLGDTINEHFMVLTMPSDSPLRRFATENAITLMDHPSDIGGRFSLFTAVGLLPAALMGLPIADFRRGAADVISTLGQATHPARLGAALQYNAIQQGKNLSVMLPYCQRLANFSTWYRQCWAESLGKNGKGSTPIRAVGTTDQHSQLQLYLDGPNDKFFTLIFHKRTGSGQVIHAPDYPELDYLKNKTTGDVIGAEQQATLETLVHNKRSVRLLTLEALNEKSLGALLAHFMLEIFFMAQLLEVDPFDQPAVEEGKILARNYLLGQA